MGLKDRMMLQIKNKNKELPSNEVANGDEAEDKELEDESDPLDDIVDDNGFVKQWQVQLDSKMNLGKKHHKKAHKLHHKKKRSSSADNIQMREPYSDQLANGDKDDDKSIHEEEDMKDDVVDYNGHTNAGYGSVNPHKWRAMNHIMPGSHITVPKALGQKVAGAKDGDDVADNTAVNSHKWRDMNHIMPGSHITVPRDSLLQLNDPDSDEVKDHTMGQTTPGHWWKDIQSLSQKTKEDDSMYL